MQTFNINLILNCVEDDMPSNWCEIHGDKVTTDDIQNELRSWLSDLGFSVEFDEEIK